MKIWKEIKGIFSLLGYVILSLFETRYKIGDKVVYRLHKHSSKPGKRATNIAPEERGENYHYDVDKYWKVRKKKPGEWMTTRLVLITRTGKKHEIQQGDKCLRKAYFWEKLLYRDKWNFKHDMRA
jgi:hypothetical protein